MKKWFGLLSGTLILCMILSACSGLTHESDPYSAIESSSISAEVVTPSSSPETSSSQPESSTVSDVSSVEESSSHSEEMLPSINTENTGFNDKFSQNSLDMAYEEEMMSAYSANEWVTICSKYSQLWQDEVDNAYKELLAVVSEDRYSSLREEQDQWLLDIESQIQQIRASAEAEGGSLVLFNASSEIMLLYRTRAAVLYQELYDYNPDFSFAFVANG